MATLTYMPTEHVPVLAPELIALVGPEPGDLVVDCTFGGGGHAELAAERIGPTGSLIALDRDPAAAERFARLRPELGCEARFARGDFAEVLERLAADGVRADVVLMDLGVSSMQLDNWERGFSYSYDAPLDMRMDPSRPLSALEVVNEWPAERLESTIRELGEERYARRIAAEIARRRPLATTSDLVEAIRAAVPPAYRFGRGHPAKRTFQAIRIAVNGELESLDRGLAAGWDVLAVGGRLGAIAFHSLEDRRVKRFLADRARGCICPPEIPVCVCGHEPEAELVSRRAVKPSEAEIERNPRSRSARLRVAKKLSDAGSTRSEAETRGGGDGGDGDS
jgi:16S rRNA (cytosine1402-N4)-methyltransferase